MGWLVYIYTHSSFFENTLLLYFQDMVLGCGDNPCSQILFFNKRCENCVNRFIHVQWRVTCTPHPHSLPSSPPPHTHTTHIHANWWWLGNCGGDAVASTVPRTIWSGLHTVHQALAYVLLPQYRYMGTHTGGVWMCQLCP